MSDVPTDWAKMRLASIVKPRYGKGLPARDRVATGTVPVYGSAGPVGFHDVVLTGGPVIIVGRKGNAGEAHLSLAGCWPIDTTYFLRVPGFVDPKFLLFQIQHANLRALDSSTAVPSLRSGDLENLQIRLPKLEKQRRVVEAIEEHFSRLDAAEASVVRALAKLHALRRRCFELTKQVAAPLRPITDVARIVSGQTPKALVVETEGQIPFYKVGDMNFADGYVMGRARGHVSKDIARRLNVHVWPPGTVIFPKRGGAIATNKKRVLVTPAAFDLNTMGLVPQQCLNSKFLLFWLETIDLAMLSDGSNVPQINHGDIANLRISLPSLDDQTRIVADIDRLLTVADQAVIGLRRAEQRAQRLRRAILEGAFCGRFTSEHPGEPVSQVTSNVEKYSTALECGD